MLRNLAKFDSLEMRNRYPTFKQEDLNNLREWLEKSPHLPKITDYEIFLFLHAAEFKVEAAKIRLDKFYTIRTHVKAVFEDRDVTKEEIKIGYEDYACFILPKPLPDNRRIVIQAIQNPDRFNYRMMLRLSNFVAEVEIFTNPKEISESLIFLIDLKNSRLSNLLQVEFQLHKQLIVYMLEAAPQRASEIHFVNAPSHMERIMNLVKPCVNKEFASKIFVHSKKDEAPAFIPKDCLPKDYGGTLKSIKELNEEHYEFLCKHREFFLEEAKCRRVNESLRPKGENFYEAELFGLEGNFRKLDID